VSLPALALGHSSLNGVSCPTSRLCMAVGGFAYGSGCTNYYGQGPCTVRTIIERWNGSRWRELQAPAGVGALSAVSCSSSRSCIAVGQGPACFATASGGACSGSGEAVAERWNGRRWSLQATPTIPGGVTPALTAVSCVSAGSCTAVGSYYLPQPNVYAPLAEAWNGTSWTVEPTPFDAQSGETTLGGVACTSPRSCTAVGALENPGATLAQRWDGTAWTVQPSPNPPNTISNGLDSVSCTSAVRCVAVGVSTYPDIASLSEAWNGARWRIVRTP
jgi:hypothetical protein